VGTLFSLLVFSLIPISQLRLDNSLAALLPTDNLFVKSSYQINRLKSSEGTFDLLLKNVNRQDLFKKVSILKHEIDAIATEYQVDAVELENDLYKIRPFLPYLLTASELDTLQERIDELIQETKEDVNPFFVDLEEDEAETDSETDKRKRVLDEFQSSSSLLDAVLKAVPYTMATDSSWIMLKVIPAFSSSDYEKSDLLYQKLQSLGNEITSAYPETKLMISGEYLHQLQKFTDVRQSLYLASIIAILTICVFLYFYLRYMHAQQASSLRIILDIALLLGLLICSFTYSLAIISLFQTRILIFSFIAFGILFGMCLDYMLHIYWEHHKSTDKTAPTISKVGALSFFGKYRIIIYSALTTSLAIASLTISDFPALEQLGSLFMLTVAINISLSIVAIPRLSAKLRHDKSPKRQKVHTSWLAFYSFLRTSTFLYSSILLTALAFFVILKAGMPGFNGSFSELEPKSRVDSVSVIRTMAELPQLQSRNTPAYFWVDPPDETKAVYEYLFHSVQDATNLNKSVESFYVRFPHTQTEIDQKSQKIERLNASMQGYEASLQDVQIMQWPVKRIMEEATVPTSEKLPVYIQNRFFSDDGNIAPLVLVYPRYSLSSGERSIAYRKEVGRITLENGETYTAASTFLVASSILEHLMQEFNVLILAPIVSILVVLAFIFRSLKPWFVVIFPAVLALLFLLAYMQITGERIHLFNIIVFPIFLGVATDNSLHLMHYLQKYGRANYLLPFVTEKFPILMVCSFSTILGFVGLLFIDHPGLQSLGHLAIAAITLDLLALLFSAIWITKKVV